MLSSMGMDRTEDSHCIVNTRSTRRADTTKESSICDQDRSHYSAISMTTHTEVDGVCVCWTA